MEAGVVQASDLAELIQPQSMRVYDIHDKEGRVFAFEINNFLNWRMGAIRVISKIPGAQITWRPSFSWFSPDVFCKFEIDGTRFQTWEPYGDSDRYWIGPDPPQWAPQIEQVRAAFMSAKWYGP